jgi:16S rRNA (uracil1498-N3)-methyltransferase
MAHFYILDELASTAVGEKVALVGAEGRHAATVSRVRVGESLKVGNGRGLMLSTSAITVEKDSVTLEVTSVEQYSPVTPRVILVQALAKNDRDERAIEACTELGIDAVIPWAAERSISRWEGPKVVKGRSRWTAIVREATKQSIRPFIPEILDYEKTSAVIRTLESSLILVLDPTGDVSLSDISLVQESPADVTVLPQSFALVVGPEGGLTPAELSLFRASGARIVTLGHNILRTSTAGPAALAVLSSRLRRL